MLDRRRLFTLGTVAAGVAIGLGVEGTKSTAHAARTHSPIPNVDVVDQEGRSFRFYDDLVKDRVVMLNFFFTSCGDTCPLVTQNLRTVQDMLGDRLGRDVFMLSVSLQPELETPAVLKDYADQWEIGQGWHLLTGRPADIEHLRMKMGFADPDPKLALVRDSHTGLLRYGNDRIDRWAGTAALGRPAWITKAVTSLADHFA